MKWVALPLLCCALACVPAPPSLDASVCPGDGGVTVEWSSAEADVVLLLDGDRASVEQNSGKKWIAADRPKFVRLAAIRENSTSWSVSKIEACVHSRDGGSGTVLLGNELPAAGQKVSINGVEATSDSAGRFAVPDGVEAYSIGYLFAYGPSLDRETSVLFEGATLSSPVVRTPIGDIARNASLTVRLTSGLAPSGPGYLTTVIARVGASGNIRDLSAPSGVVNFPGLYWHGSPTTRVTITAVRQYVKSLVTDNVYDRPEILGASLPLEIDLREGESFDVEVDIQPVEEDVRDLFLPSEFSNTAALIAYGAPGDGPVLYSGRAGAQSKLPVVRGPGYWDHWGVSEPVPVDGTFESGARGSGDFVVAAEGAVIAPLYRAARLTTVELPVGNPVLQWEMPQACLCRAGISRPSGLRDWVVYSVGPVDLRKAGISAPGNYTLTLDCYPELAGTDDFLEAQRGAEFARGIGRRARVQTTGTFVIR